MKNWQKDYDLMAKKMDLRHDMLTKLKNLVDKSGGVIPEDYKEEYDAFRRDGFKNWRHMPKVVKRLIKAAKKAAKAPGLEELTRREKEKGEKYLREKGVHK